jgi:hypothetical protein
MRNTSPDTSPDASEEDETTVSDTEDNSMALSDNDPTLLTKHDSDIVGMQFIFPYHEPLYYILITFDRCCSLMLAIRGLYDHYIVSLR